MADREPRRRKKRKDSTKKEDHHIDDSSSTMAFHKLDTKDLDPDTEEDIILPASHQPSKLAQVVFMILFLALAGAMSFVIIALHGSSSQLELINVEDDHAELEPLLPDVDAEHSETHEEEELIDIFPDLMKQFQAVVGGGEDEENISDKDKVTIDSDKITLSDFAEKQPLPTEENILTDSISDFEDTKESNAINIEHDEDINVNINTDDTASVIKEPPSTISSETDIKENIEDVVKIAEPAKEEILVQPKTENQNLIKDDELPKSSSPVFPQSDSMPDDDDEEEEEEDDDDDFPLKTTLPPTEPMSTINIIKLNESITESSLAEDIKPVENDKGKDLPNRGDTLPDKEDALPNKEDSLPNKEHFQSEYENADITNREDYAIRDQLDEIEKILEKSPNNALKKYEAILKVNATSPRALYGKARAFDLQADVQRSNEILENAITAYQKLMNTEDVPEKLYLSAGTRCVERMQFRGFIGKSIKLLLEMEKKLPKNIEIKNKIAVGYLLIGRNKDAKQAFIDTLKEAPDNGFAKVHLGFILKTDESDYEKAIKLMIDGIKSREPGVIDGRFFLHLGDALARTGQVSKAMEIYEDGVKEGVFLSVYQRSLYNVNGLTGKPWWEPHSMTYAPYFKILEKNWINIRDEVLAVIQKQISNFSPESEGLQDKGDWKQFELFARGRKMVKNCEQVPKTCSLLENMPDASRCKRGQVKFSIMKPGTHVWAHNGPTNCRLRAHLGLVTPSGANIRVANETRMWTEGKVILFDDSFEHEVWHNGTSDRLVLIVDFWHPELTDKQRASLSPI